MRTINLNGYIDEEVWYGDEITPSMLHDALYGENNEFSDDVRIILNSYGGSCNAAVRMHDDIRAYPGRVHLVISGTAGIRCDGAFRCGGHAGDDAGQSVYDP